jgi:hypothetical protein
VSVLVLSVAALESVPEVDVSSAKTKFELVSARPAVMSNARSKLLFICSSEVMQRQTRAWLVFIWGHARLVSLRD